jgi:hypothetical protein
MRLGRQAPSISGSRRSPSKSFEVLSDTLLRTDSVSGATTHLLELEIARALKPLTLERLDQLGYASADTAQRFLRNARSARVAHARPGAQPARRRRHVGSRVMN